MCIWGGCRGRWRCAFLVVVQAVWLVLGRAMDLEIGTLGLLLSATAFITPRAPQLLIVVRSMQLHALALTGRQPQQQGKQQQQQQSRALIHRFRDPYVCLTHRLRTGM